MAGHGGGGLYGKGDGARHSPLRRSLEAILLHERSGQTTRSGQELQRAYDADLPKDPHAEAAVLTSFELEERIWSESGERLAETGVATEDWAVLGAEPAAESTEHQGAKTG